MKDEKAIRIIADGPYIVSQSISLIKEQTRELKPLFVKKYSTEEYVHNGNYALCRCGNSSNAPFCSGAHVGMNFDGTETASNAPYVERAETIESNELTLLDDQRCAFARYCHREHGNVWELIENSENPEYRDEAILGASLCPTGRLTVVNEANEMLEIDYEPQIAVTDDPEHEVSAGLYVRGYIPVISAKGFRYEVRNRVALCRCGHSNNKPFCDSSHISAGFQDGESD